MLRQLLLSMRPADWIKNLLVFAPLVFSKNLFHIDLFLLTLAASLIFCGASGAAYIINDIKDYDSDRAHPIKAIRPIASKALSVRNALFAAFMLHGICLIFSWSICPRLLIIIISYMLLSAFYSFLLQTLVILDVMAISAGFILRVLAGSAAIGIQTSNWLIICTGQIALLLALGKRRLLNGNQEDGFKAPGTISFGYDPKFLDQMIAVSATSSVICYTLYTMSERTIEKLGSMNMIYTIPFVVYGIFRYFYLVLGERRQESAIKIMLIDKPMVFNMILWMFVVVLVLYGKHFKEICLFEGYLFWP